MLYVIYRFSKLISMALLVLACILLAGYLVGLCKIYSWLV
jgi:hypothetical protein